MQLCSLHHCLLFFILTFTTAPVSALEICSIRGKLHQPVILSCTHRCPGLFEWNLLSKRSVVLAKCNRTSCWAEKGFSITHDQYLKGDFSLTITEADYSQRNVYACECGDSDYALVRLVIETVFTPVQMKYDEDLKLKVSVPEPVEVIYKSDDAADEVICNVTKDSLQCKDDYRHRTSLTYPELTLKHMTKGDSGSYTIRDIKNNEDIQIYAVSVEEKPGFPAWGIVLIAILPCCCIGAGIFLQYKRRMRKQLERRQQQVDLLVQEALGGTEEKIREVETSVEQLQWQYNNTVYEDKVKVFCSDKRRQLLERRQQQVDQLVKDAEGGTVEEIREVETSLSQLQQQYNKTVYKNTVKVFCNGKRIQLLERRLQQVDQLVQEALRGTEKEIREAETSVDQLQQQYNKTVYEDQVKEFCSEKREQLMKWRQQQVDQLVKEAEGGTEEKISEVMKSLDQLQQRYNNTVYKDTVKEFCREKREQLLERRQQQVDKLVKEAEGGTEEKIREAEKSFNQLQHQYKDTEYKDNVKEFCREKREQLINRRLQPAVQPLKKQEELKKKDTEYLESELNQLLSLYRNTEHLNDVLLLCMELRSQISWNRLQYSKEEPFMTTRRELNRKLLHVEQLVQQAEAGTDEKIKEAEKAIDELEQQYSDTEYSLQVSMLCDVKRDQLNSVYRKKGVMIQDRKWCPMGYRSRPSWWRTDVELLKKLLQQEQLVKEDISQAEKEISRLELKYFTTEYSGYVSFLCMKMRAKLFWYRQK